MKLWKRAVLVALAIAGLAAAPVVAHGDALPPTFDASLAPALSGIGALTAFSIPPDTVSYWLRHVVVAYDDIRIQWLRQDAYNDNGDGIISAGDWVTLEGVAYLVQDTGSMVQGHAYFGWYWGDYTDRETTIEILTPDLVPDVPGSCQMWWPYFVAMPVFWYDQNLNGELDIGDNLAAVQLYVSVDRICPKVTLQGFDVIPVVPATWSSIKGMFEESPR